MIDIVPLFSKVETILNYFLNVDTIKRNNNALKVDNNKLKPVANCPGVAIISTIVQKTKHNKNIIIIL